jgi:hypothetical protein
MQLFRQKLSRRLKTHWCIIFLGALLLCVPTSSVFSNDATPDELKEQQLKLQKILDEIGDMREQRSEQKAVLEKLSEKMQCNWDLIQDYDACSKKYKEQKQEQLSCAQKAKERARGCLSDIGE